MRASFYRAIRKSTTILLSFALLLPYTHADEMAAAFQPVTVLTLPPQFALQPPAALGHVADYFNAPSNDAKLVILIQDLHAHYGVQKNIAGILDFLTTQLNCRGARLCAQPVESNDQGAQPCAPTLPFALAAEGGAGPIDSSVMALFPDPEIKESAADYLMRQGELTGAEYFGIMRGLPTAVTGVENGQYYALHRELFRKTLADRQELVGILHGIATDLRPLNHRLYGSRLRHFQNRLDAYDQGELSTPEFIRELNKTSHDVNLDWKGDFPELAHYAVLVDAALPTGEELVRLTRAFINESQSYFSPRERQILKQLAGEKETTHYYLYLRDLITQHQLFLAVPPELSRYLEALHILQTMGFDTVSYDAQQLAFRLKLKIAAEGSERDLVQVEHDLALLIRMANVQATELEVKSFGPRFNQFVAFCHALLVSNGVHAFDEERIRTLISSSIDYYAMALMRNEPMVDNTLQLLKAGDQDGGVAGAAGEPERRGVVAYKKRHRSPPFWESRLSGQPATPDPRRSVAVLVTGGFHTAPIARLLRQKNISYIVITPMVNQITVADQALYIKRLSGDLLTVQDVLADAKNWNPSANTQLLSNLSPAGLQPGLGLATTAVSIAALFVASVYALGHSLNLPEVRHFLNTYPGWAGHFQAGQTLLASVPLLGATLPQNSPGQDAPSDATPELSGLVPLMRVSTSRGTGTIIQIREDYKPAFMAPEIMIQMDSGGIERFYDNNIPDIKPLLADPAIPSPSNLKATPSSVESRTEIRTHSSGMKMLISWDPEKRRAMADEKRRLETKYPDLRRDSSLMRMLHWHLTGLWDSVATDFLPKRIAADRTGHFLMDPVQFDWVYRAILSMDKNGATMRELLKQMLLDPNRIILPRDLSWSSFSPNRCWDDSTIGLDQKISQTVEAVSDLSPDILNLLSVIAQMSKERRKRFHNRLLQIRTIRREINQLYILKRFPAAEAFVLYHGEPKRDHSDGIFHLLDPTYVSPSEEYAQDWKSDDGAVIEIIVPWNDIEEARETLGHMPEWIVKAGDYPIQRLLHGSALSDASVQADNSAASAPKTPNSIVYRFIRAFLTEWSDRHPKATAALGLAGLAPEIFGIRLLVNHTHPVTLAIALGVFALLHIALLIREHRARGDAMPNLKSLGWIFAKQYFFFLLYAFIPFRFAAAAHLGYDALQILDDGNQGSRPADQSIETPGTPQTRAARIASGRALLQQIQEEQNKADGASNSRLHHEVEASGIHSQGRLSRIRAEIARLKQAPEAEIPTDILYARFLIAVYDHIRRAHYDQTERDNPQIVDAILHPSEGMVGQWDPNWSSHRPSSVPLAVYKEKPIDIVSINAFADPRLIAALDGYFGKSQLKVIYKVPSTLDKWLNRHDTVVIYFFEPLTEEIKATLIDITRPYIRNADHLIGSKLADGIYVNRNPSEREAMALIDEAAAIDPELGQAVRMLFSDRRKAINPSIGEFEAARRVVQFCKTEKSESNPGSATVQKRSDPEIADQHEQKQSATKSEPPIIIRVGERVVLPIAERLAKIHHRLTLPMERGNGWIRIIARPQEALAFHQKNRPAVGGEVVTSFRGAQYHIPLQVWNKMMEWSELSPDLERPGFLAAHQNGDRYDVFDFIPGYGIALDPTSIDLGNKDPSTTQTTDDFFVLGSGIDRDMAHDLDLDLDAWDQLSYRHLHAADPNLISIPFHSHHIASLNENGPSHRDHETSQGVEFVYCVKTGVGHLFDRNGDVAVTPDVSDGLPKQPSLLTFGELFNHFRWPQAFKAVVGILFNWVRYPFSSALREKLNGEIAKLPGSVSLILADEAPQGIRYETLVIPWYRMLWDFGRADEANRIIYINPLLPWTFKERVATHEALHIAHPKSDADVAGRTVWTESHVIAMTDFYMNKHRANAIKPQTLAFWNKAIAQAPSKPVLSDIIPDLLAEAHLKPLEAASITAAYDKSKAFIIAA